MGNKASLCAIVCLLVLTLASPAGVIAQPTERVAATEQQNTYTQEQLDELLAPVALYPDSLLSQILMASTYPLEVVEADRWLKRNPGITGDRLDEALNDMSWDASVKSLCHFPQVLDMMSVKLEDTDVLGNAFLSQQDQVLDTIQRLRAKARAAGNLASTDKEKVIVEDPYISIEPIGPDVIYVPAYNPCWVYGPWWYPVCSPWWFWWPGLVADVGFRWGPPIFVGPAGFWCGFHWHRHQLFLKMDRIAFLGRVGVSKMHGGVETWQHDPIHRRGVAYRDDATTRRFGQGFRPGVEARRAFRGLGPEGRETLQPSRREGIGGRAPAQAVGRPDGFNRSERQQGITPPGSGRSEIQLRREPGDIGPRSFQRPGAISPFEGFGRSGPEVRQHSERGFQSMGRGFQGGGRGFGGQTRSGIRNR